MPKPFIKWVGGKTKLLPTLLAHLPETYVHYHEPFLGGGALFFALEPLTAILSDVNPHLINAYKAVQQYRYKLKNQLKQMAVPPTGQEQYTAWRNYWNLTRGQDQLRIANAAALFIYLNKTCFNGLYRENAKGEFNVPWGKRDFPDQDYDNIDNCALSLIHAEILCQPFQSSDPSSRDFVYVDPPYDKTCDASFTKYTKHDFDTQDQKDLAAWANEKSAKGVQILLSNSDTPLIRSLYSDFKLIEVKNGRAVAAKSSSRGKVTELLIKNY